MPDRTGDGAAEAAPDAPAPDPPVAAPPAAKWSPRLMLGAATAIVMSIAGLTAPGASVVAFARQILAERHTDARSLNGHLVNDFQEVVFRTHTPVAAAHSALVAAGAEFAQMSGSGSSVYALFGSEDAAHAAGERLSGMACRVHLTPPHFQAA